MRLFRLARFFRFSLRTLLVGVSVVAVAFGLIIAPGRRQRDAVAVIRRSGSASVEYIPAYGTPVKFSAAKISDWCVRQIGVDYFRNVYCVMLSLKESKAEINAIAQIGSLRKLFISSGPLSREDVGKLSQLPELRWIYLHDCCGVDGAPLSNELQPLMDSRSLDALWMHYRSVSDPGLAFVGQIPNLRLLHLSQSNITDEGIKHLTGLTELEELVLDRTRITDEGLKELSALKRLRYLMVAGTKVTAVGIREFIVSTEGRCTVLWDDRQTFDALVSGVFDGTIIPCVKSK